MVNEITITAKFTTGTSVQDPEQAKREVERLFLKVLRKVYIYGENDVYRVSGLFNVEIVKVESEKI